MAETLFGLVHTTTKTNNGIPFYKHLRNLQYNITADHITETSFKKALDMGYKDPNAVHFHLAQIYEETKRPDMAMASYQMVKSGGRYLPAQIRYADLLALKGHLKEAREHLQKLPAANDQQTAHLILAEAQILRRSKAHREVFDLLNHDL